MASIETTEFAVGFPPCPEFFSIFKVIMVGSAECCSSYRIHIQTSTWMFPNIKKFDHMIFFKTFRQNWYWHAGSCVSQNSERDRTENDCLCYDVLNIFYSTLLEFKCCDFTKMISSVCFNKNKDE